MSLAYYLSLVFKAPFAIFIDFKSMIYPWCSTPRILAFAFSETTLSVGGWRRVLVPYLTSGPIVIARPPVPIISVPIICIPLLLYSHICRIFRFRVRIFQVSFHVVVESLSPPCIWSFAPFSLTPISDYPHPELNLELSYPLALCFSSFAPHTHTHK